MKVIYRSYKYRIYPNKQQKILLDKHFGCTRFVYNFFLNEKKQQYKINKKSDNYYKQAKTLTDLKRQEDYNWLKEVNSQSLQFTLKSLDTAFINFYKKKSNYPRFKSKKKKNSFTVLQSTKLIDSKIYIPKFKGGIKVKDHRKINGKINRMTFSKTSTGKYFVSILVEEEYQPKKKTGDVCGIDLGLKDFIITSDSKRFKNNRYINKYQDRLKKAQQHLSRKKRGSQSFENQKRKIARIHEKISNTRKDNLHKVSNQLISKYDIICLEDLNVKGMIKNKKLSKHIADVSWSMFIQFLEYKADWNNKQVIKIDRFYPSSKTCFNCGWVKDDLNLSDRQWFCPSCGLSHDRDINAAKNILREGLKDILSAGTVDYTDGDSNKTSKLLKQKSMKSEVHWSLANG